ncbi:MAG: GNAT family N-acetyltransferase [Bryobacteraceae bacterium]|nr:GNAT family N-acetyltransferase [Bryobacteraceae bacterium]MDW8379773.1 GNAT family N-acetyltransferase [Bryobacterales bacterium]
MNPQTLLDLLPDVPRYVDARGMLLRGTAEIFGEDLANFALYDADAQVGVLVGVPAASELRRLEALCTEQSVLLASSETAAELRGTLSGWRCETAILHILHDVRHLPVSEGVRLLTPAEIDSLELEQELKQEFADAALFSPLSAAYADGKPVSFCYASWQTESFWDISIDTLPEYQRQGHATRNLAWMIRFQHEAGRLPVWGAVEGNLPSLNLARKLGFIEADRICVFGR